MNQREVEIVLEQAKKEILATYNDGFKNGANCALEALGRLIHPNNKDAAAKIVQFMIDGVIK